jgi:hypothetical protein
MSGISFWNFVEFTSVCYIDQVNTKHNNVHARVLYQPHQKLSGNDLTYQYNTFTNKTIIYSSTLTIADICIDPGINS